MNKLKNLESYVKENRKLIKIGAVIIIIITALLVFGGKGENDTIQLNSEDAIPSSHTAEKAEQKTEKIIYIDISGRVNKPGVYQVKEGSRIYEVIDKAGGPSKGADTTNINQAEVATDGQKIIIPSKDDINSDTNTNTNYKDSGINSNSDLININSADSSKLQEITGVGPSTADKIINYRQSNGNFKKKEDLMNVSGIGEKTFEKIKDKITV